MRIHHKSRPLFVAGFIGAAVVVVATVLLITHGTPAPSTASAAAGFNAGRIIDDAVFYNPGTMTVSQIQSFLNSKVPTCDTWGQKIYSGTKTRAQSGTERGVPPPYTCLKDYRMDIPEKAANNYCGRIPAATNQTAAQIIYAVSQACGINPQVFLVLLQKEQSLVTDEWPFPIQYRSATGYGCPDTAACDSAYYGFYNQVYRAGWQYKVYRANPNSYNYRAGRNNYIQYNPDTRCGGSTVYIENQATAGLYIYTPYQPNAYALNGGTSSAYPNCGAFGNKNFFNLFTSWFGSTYAYNWVGLETQRYMQIKNGAQKIDILTGNKVGEMLASGRQLKFIDKTLLNGIWYLRTEYDHTNNISQAIPQSELEDISYTAITPKLVQLKEDGWKSFPAARTVVIGSNLTEGTVLKVVDEINIDGNSYFRTEFDHNFGVNSAIHSRFLVDFSPVSLDEPREFYVNKKGASKVNLLTDEFQLLTSREILFINRKIFMNDIWYFQTSSDSGSYWFINSSDLLSGRPPSVSYVPFETPRDLKILVTTVRIHPITKEPADSAITAGQIVHFSTKVLIGGQWYYRTTYNTLRDIDAVLPASLTTDL